MKNMTEIDNKLIEMKRESENEKEMGNKHFKSGDIEEAIKCYSKAIQLFPMNPIFYCNRSMAYLKKGLYDNAIEAESDCNSALNIDEKCIKALYRRGMSRKQLFRYSLALDDFKQVLTLEPNNKESIRELESIQSLIESKALVDIKPIHKNIDFQSNKPLIKVPIIEKNSINIKDFEPKVPENAPKNYYQLECDWRQLIGSNCKQLRLKYLEMIGSETIQTLLTATLEPQMLSDLLNTISESNDLNLIYCVLRQMSRTPRFDTLVLFLSTTDQNILKSTIDKLKRNFDENLIKELEKQYFL